GTLENVRKALEGAGVPVESAENAMIARQTVELDSQKARQALRLVELLEDLDDVQRVTANFDIPEDVFAEVAGGSSSGSTREQRHSDTGPSNGPADGGAASTTAASSRRPICRSASGSSPSTT